MWSLVSIQCSKGTLPDFILNCISPLLVFHYVSKIHGDGRVESITKVNRDGIKADKYDNELPLETAKTTVVRDSTYVTLKHELGIEIRCNVKRNLCTFSIAKWYHGRLMGKERPVYHFGPS